MSKTTFMKVISATGQKQQMLRGELTDATGKMPEAWSAIAWELQQALRDDISYARQLFRARSRMRVKKSTILPSLLADARSALSADVSTFEGWREVMRVSYYLGQASSELDNQLAVEGVFV